MKIEKIEVKPNSKLRIQCLTYLGDIAGCGNIRVIIPSILLNQFFNRNFEFNAFFLNKFTRDLSIYKNMVFVTFQRSATKDQLEYFRTVKTKIFPLTKTRVLYEIDDLLFDIPKWNYASDFYNTNKQYLEAMLTDAHGITVSTSKLKELYSKYNKNISVVPNHLMKCIWGEPSFQYQNNKKPIIVYPCSSNHFSVKKDINGGDIGPALMNFIRKTVNDYDWTFIGGLPVELTDLKTSGKLKWHMWQTLFNYPAYLKSIKADIGIAPLESNTFNACKSNIKVLEYTAAGIPGVYKNIDPYYNTTIKANTEEEMISHIETMLKNPDLRKEVWEKDYEKVKSQLFWEENDNLLEFLNSSLRLIGREIDKKDIVI